MSDEHPIFLYATRHNMRQVQGNHPGYRIVAYSPYTHEKASADSADYFGIPDNQPLKDEDGNLMLLGIVVPEHVRLIRADGRDE